MTNIVSLIHLAKSHSLLFISSVEHFDVNWIYGWTLPMYNDFLMFLVCHFVSRNCKKSVTVGCNLSLHDFSHSSIKTLDNLFITLHTIVYKYQQKENLSWTILMLI